MIRKKYVIKIIILFKIKDYFILEESTYIMYIIYIKKKTSTPRFGVFYILQ